MVEVRAGEESPNTVRAAVWALFVYGLLMLGVGLFLIASPHETLKVLTVVFGVTLILDGVVAMMVAAVGAAESRGVLAMLGIISLVAGLVLVKKPFSALYLLVAILGIWFVVAGFARFAYSFTFSEGRVKYMLVAAIDVAVGVVILSWAHITLSTLAVIMGIVLVARGIAYVYFAWHMLKLEREGNVSAAPFAV